MPVPAAAVTRTTLPASSPWPSISFGATARLISTLPLSSRTSSSTNFSRQAEHPFGDDIALDLVGPAVDGVGPGEQEQVLPLIEVTGFTVSTDQAGLAQHVHGQLAQSAMPVGPQQLRHVVLAGPLDVHGGQGVRAHGTQPRPRAGEPLPDRRVVDGPVLARQRDDAGKLTRVTDLLAQRG